MLKPPLVYILIVNYNNWTDSVDCIQHILKSNYTNYKIILVDNASTNESILKIEKIGRAHV